MFMVTGGDACAAERRGTSRRARVAFYNHQDFTIQLSYSFRNIPTHNA
jgi:hypothetical protein